MKASHSERQRINRLRRRGAKMGRRNGVLGPWAFDFWGRSPLTSRTVYDRATSKPAYCIREYTNSDGVTVT